MIKEFDHVRIKGSKTTGIVVDIRNLNGSNRYLIESDGESNDIIDCSEDELVKTNVS